MGCTSTDGRTRRAANASANGGRYAGGRKGAQARAWCARQFWETLHIDLRMVDTSDFTISYCPTNIYSVGTPHEIIMATLQHKPVLFVSPPIRFPSLHRLRAHLKGDARGTRLLESLDREIPIKENPRGVRVCGISRWWAAKIFSTDSGLPATGGGWAGRPTSRLTGMNRSFRPSVRYCHSSRS